MRPINAIIMEIREETSAIRSLKFELSLDPAPGQYVMVWVRGIDEIPMSFSSENEITVLAAGEASQALTRLQPGDNIGLRGPLGNGFVLRGDSILLIGGGVGVAPLAFLGEQARSVGIKVTSLIGFRSSEDVIFQSRFERLGDTIVTTEDGSKGILGRASIGLKKLDMERYGQVYLCGPEMMMLDVISRAKEHASKIQASINRYFKCAIGVCGSCCLDPFGQRVCVEGPIIMADRLLESEFGRYKRGPSGGRDPCGG